MTKDELIRATQARLGQDWSLKGVQHAVDAAVAEIAQAMTRGDSLRLPGLGTFSQAERAAYRGRNPQTGEPIDIAAKKRVMFRASGALQRAMEAPTSPQKKSKKAGQAIKAKTQTKPGRKNASKTPKGKRAHVA